MQGISKTRHEHLIDALLQLERLLSTRPQECDCLPQTAGYRMELERMHRDYERRLDDLSVLIAEYETLFSEVKVHWLGRKLKELRKEMTSGQPDFVAMVDGIRLAYGT